MNEFELGEECAKCTMDDCCQNCLTVSKTDKEKILEHSKVSFEELNEDAFVLRFPEKQCPFHKNNLCEIHHDKPIGCKCWPIVQHPETEELYVYSKCPMKNKLSKEFVEFAKNNLEKQSPNFKKAYWGNNGEEFELLKK